MILSDIFNQFFTSLPAIPPHTSPQIKQRFSFFDISWNVFWDCIIFCCFEYSFFNHPLNQISYLDNNTIYYKYKTITGLTFFNITFDLLISISFYMYDCNLNKLGKSFIWKPWLHSLLSAYGVNKMRYWDNQWQEWM